MPRSRDLVELSTPLASQTLTAYTIRITDPFGQGSTLLDVTYLDFKPSYVFRVKVEDASTDRQSPLVGAHGRPRDVAPDKAAARSASDRTGAHPDWVTEGLAERIRVLLELRGNWNRDGAPPITPEAARAAFELALQIKTPSTLAPSIIPTQSGGIQLEWHKGHIDIELELDAQGDVNLWYDDDEGGIEREERLPSLRAGAQEVNALLAILESRTM